MFTPFAIYTNKAAAPAPPAFAYLFDDYSGYLKGYSLRQLLSTYTGSAIEVRRDSDGTTQDIGFVSNELDTASLLSFVGASGTGTVRTWYDQSGNGFDLRQTNATYQPMIVDAGTLVTGSADWNYALKFPSNNVGTGTGKMQSIITTAVSQPDIFYVNGWDASPQDDSHIFDGQGLRQLLGTFSGGQYVGYAGGVVSSATSPTVQAIWEAYFNGGSSHIGYNGSITATGNIGSSDIGGLQIAQENFDGYLTEIVQYNSSGYSSRSGILSNINGYWSTY